MGSRGKIGEAEGKLRGRDVLRRALGAGIVAAFATSPAMAASDADLAAATAKAKATVEKFSSMSPKLFQLPLKNKPPAGKKVILLSLGSSSLVLYTYGLEEATKLLGWDFRTVKWNGSPESAQAAADQAIALKPDLIIASAVPTDALTRQRKAMKEAGITFLDVNAVYKDPDNISDPPIAILQGQADLKSRARMLADFMIADSGAKARSLFVNVPDFVILNSFGEGVAERYKELCPDTCKQEILKFQYSDVGKSLPSGVISYLQRNPQINYINTSADLEVGLTQALRSVGLLDQVKIVGWGPYEPQLEALKNGTNKAWLAAGAPTLAWLMLHTYLHYLEGAKFPLQATNPEDSLPPMSPRVFVTAENAAGIDTKKPFNKPDDYREQFKKLWHLD